MTKKQDANAAEGATDAPDADIDGYFSTARVTGRDEAVELPDQSYLDFLLDRDDPQIAGARGMTYREFAEDRWQAPFLQELMAFWRALYDEPFVGVTTDGTPEPGLWPLARTTQDDPGLTEVAERLLARLDPGQRDQLRYDLDAPEWRAWSNPEFVVHQVGLRLEELGDDQVDAVLDLVRASLSPAGYDQVREAMALNGYLGELVDLPTVLNERSYFFALYGTPSPKGSWGWQLFGHHVAVNFVTVGGRHVLAPVFLGGEPALTEGLRPPLFSAREELAVRLASSFDAEQRRQAVVYASVLDSAMPPGRLHPADERTLGGAFRDNRVVPYEGVRAADLDAAQRDLLRAIVTDFHGLLNDEQRAATMAEYDEHVDQTWFCWYGATDGSQPFYFRVQSPVVLAELDHHAGVWLTNRLPARFHVHTVLRLPHGNDYARAYLAQLDSRTTG